MTVAIKVENLSKKYLIQHEKKSAHYETFSESIIQTGKSVIDKIRLPWGNGGIEQSTEEEFWALKNINFEINQGDKVGVIGRNGAGKSTLLKVLSRITGPTTGKIHINGRIASLLEVGTGFHPELTGRENIFLNGAILGMSRKEIRKKFDEIVAFAEVDKFLDTPVKRYSSGMYVRLAFAVAAHLESEILVVDEVLAVGDARFQRKCLGKMREVSKAGRTILFVSHNMAAIKALCDFGIYMCDGKALPISSVSDAFLNYSVQDKESNRVRFPVEVDELIIYSVDIGQDDVWSLSELDGSKQIKISIEFEVLSDLNLFRLGFFVKGNTGELLLRSLLADWNEDYEDIKAGKYCVTGIIDRAFFIEGSYLFELHASRYGIKDYGVNKRISIPIKILSPAEYNTAHIGEPHVGVVLAHDEWTINKYLN